MAHYHQLTTERHHYFHLFVNLLILASVMGLLFVITYLVYIQFREKTNRSKDSGWTEKEIISTATANANANANTTDSITEHFGTEVSSFDLLKYIPTEQRNQVVANYPFLSFTLGNRTKGDTTDYLDLDTTKKFQDNVTVIMFVRFHASVTDSSQQPAVFTSGVPGSRGSDHKNEFLRLYTDTVPGQQKYMSINLEKAQGTNQYIVTMYTEKKKTDGSVERSPIINEATYNDHSNSNGATYLPSVVFNPQSEAADEKQFVSNWYLVHIHYNANKAHLSPSGSNAGIVTKGNEAVRFMLKEASDVDSEKRSIYKQFLYVDGSVEQQTYPFNDVIDRATPHVTGTTLKTIKGLTLGDLSNTAQNNNGFDLRVSNFQLWNDIVNTTYTA